MEQALRPSETKQVVVDHAGSKLSDLWKKEDYWAIWLGFALMIFGMFLFLLQPPAGMGQKMDNLNKTLAQEVSKASFKTIAWHMASAEKAKIRASNEPHGVFLKNLMAAPADWNNNPIDSLYLSESAAKELSLAAMPAYEKAARLEKEALVKAQASESAALQAGAKDAALNQKAKEDIGAWLAARDKASKAKAKTQVKPYNRFWWLIGLAVLMSLFFSPGTAAMGRPVKPFIKGFFFVFGLAVVAYMAEVQQTMKLYGFGFPLWAILIGMLISNTIGTPEWIKPALQTEYYIKTGLVLLGAEVLFTKILAIGTPGIFVAWVVTPVVLVSTFWFGQKILKIESKTLNITVSADMSVCGVSAAIATASACRAKKEELTLAIGMSMVFTAIMMVAMPAFIKLVGMPEILGGAWIGGTVDSTGAVAAAGAFLGEKALYVAATVKMIQNVLIGVIAFGVAVYWCAKVECVEGQKVSWMEIWYRLPRFVLGFIVASIMFSYLDSALGRDASSALLDHGVLRGFTRLAREWFFALAFASIGLATNFKELGHYFKGGKPLILYVCGQSFNLILTLAMAYVMFYLVFPDILALI